MGLSRSERLQYLAVKEREEEYLSDLHGPPPVCIFRKYRELYRYSFQQLAHQSGLSKNALIRAENGTYTNPLPSLIDFWVRKCSQPSVHFEEGYADFQYYQRLRYFHYFGASLQDGYSVNTNAHPFRQLRKNRISHSLPQRPMPTGLDEVSKALCLPVDTLRYWEKKFRQQQTVPKQVNSVLLFIGYTQSEVQEFNRDYESWRKKNLVR